MLQSISRQKISKYPKNRNQENRTYPTGENHHIYKKNRYTIDPLTGCWNWNLKIENSGYPRISINNGRNQMQAHQFYYEQKYGPIPEGTEMDHTCKNSHCVNPDHLEPVTKLINIERSNIFKVTKEQVIEIRKLVKEGINQREVAKLFGICQQNVHKICSFRSRTKL